MNNTIESNTDDPKKYLSVEILGIINAFVERNKLSYVPFNPDEPNKHYYDCSIYSRDLYEILKDKLSYKLSYLIITDKDIKKLYGTSVEFPGRALHSALYIKDLNIVIEPQNGKIFYLDEKKHPNAFDYYTRVLGMGKGKLMYMDTPELRLKNEDIPSN